MSSLAAPCLALTPTMWLYLQEPHMRLHSHGRTTRCCQSAGNCPKVVTSPTDDASLKSALKLEDYAEPTCR
jgi:hypothetical protein